MQTDRHHDSDRPKGRAAWKVLIFFTFPKPLRVTVHKKKISAKEKKSQPQRKKNKWKCKFSSKGWDPSFLIRAIGLSEKVVISFGFVFSGLGLKSQNLQLHQKKIKCFFVQSFLISDLLLQLNALNVLSIYKITWIELSLWKV